VVRQVEVIRRIHARGVTIVLIEHHMDVVTSLCDVVTVLDGGRVIAEGKPDQVKREPRVIAAYLGSAAPPPGAAPAPAAG
jgi:branched-chain amino acid transport system permease protein